jgi:16S rRNA (guanine527-N7)-methyltransferase
VNTLGRGLSLLRESGLALGKGGLSSEEALGAALDRYLRELELFNPAYGLVKVRDREDLVVRHLLDSLAPLPAILSRVSGVPGAAADAGSGAGLPGIPLAAALPGVSFTLIERMGRRAGFLRSAAAVLGLGNIVVEEGEVEKAAPGRFGLVVFRAFRPLGPAVLKGLFRLLAPGGMLAAWKGRREKAEAEMAAVEGAMPELGGCWEVIPVRAPLLSEERHLTLIRPAH